MSIAVTKIGARRDPRPREQAERAFTVRSVLAGMVSAAAVCFLVTWAELVISSIKIGYLQLPPVSIAILSLFVAANAAVKNLFAGRLKFSPRELTVVYIMALIAAMVSSHGMVEKWIPLLVTPNYFADDTNNWAKLFSHMPHWLVPYNPVGAAKQNVSVWFYEGLPRGGAIPWGPWIVPIAMSGMLLLSVVTAFFFLTSILRKQWVENERLTFPLAQLPLEMIGSDAGASFFRNPLTWVGIAIPTVFYGVNWIHQVAPTWPSIPTTFTLNTILTNPPYNALEYTPFIISFAAIGFFFLLPSDMLLSIWFFFVLTRLEQAVALNYAIDTSSMPLYPAPLYVGYQTVGAYFVLIGYFFLIAKPHLTRVWQAIIGRGAEKGQDEAASYRTSFFGLVASLLVAASLMILFGMSWWLAALELLVFVFVIAVVLARSTAEAGMMMTETTFRPIDIYRMVGNIHNLGPVNLTMLSFVDNLMLRDQRGLLLTGFFDSFKIADGVGLGRRKAGGVIALAVLLSLAIAVPLQIAIPYIISAGRMDAWMMHGSPTVSFADYRNYFSPSTPPICPPWKMAAFTITGAITTIVLCVLRARLYWWPLNPLGYALSGSWSTVQFWFPCLIAWIIKSVIMRYGGSRLYQQVRPLMLGLILGEFGIAVIAVLVNAIFKIPPPAFPWG